MKNPSALPFLLASTLLITLPHFEGKSQTVSSASQVLSFSLNYGHEFRRPKKYRLIKVFGSDSSGYYAYLRSTKGIARLMRFEANLSVSREADLLISQDGEKCQINNILFCGARLYAFYHVSNPEKPRGLWVDEIDPINLRPMGKSMNLIPLTESVVFPGDWNYADVSLSPDGTHVLVKSRVGQENSELLLLKVFDSKLNLIWGRKVVIPWLVQLKAIQVDHSGDLYLFGKIAHRYIMDGLADYFMLEIKDDGKTEQWLALDSADNRLGIVHMCAGSNQLVCLGIRQRSFDLKTIDLLTGKTTDLEIEDPQSNGFPVDSLRLGPYRNVAVLSPIDTILFDGRGRIVALRERYYSTVDEGSRWPTTMHHFEAISVVGITLSGGIDKPVTIEKTQSGNRTLLKYLSYYVAVLKGKLCFFYNEGKGTILVQIDADGVLSKATIMRKDRRLRIVPGSCQQVSGDELIMVRGWNRRQQLVKLVVD